MATLPFPNGSHAKPSRGSKLRRVGLEKYGSPKWGRGSVMRRSVASLPCASLGTVAISYRIPRFTVKFLYHRKSSWAYAAARVCRSPLGEIVPGSPIFSESGRFVRKSEIDLNVNTPFGLLYA